MLTVNEQMKCTAVNKAASFLPLLETQFSVTQDSSSIGRSTEQWVIFSEMISHALLGAYLFENVHCLRFRFSWVSSVFSLVGPSDLHLLLSRNPGASSVFLVLPRFQSIGQLSVVFVCWSLSFFIDNCCFLPIVSCFLL